MLWTIAVILIILWLLGLVTSYTMGGFVHILLVIAVIVVVVSLIQGEEGHKKHLTEKKKLDESKNIIAIILIAAGVVVFTYQGITYTTREKVIDCPATAAACDQKPKSNRRNTMKSSTKDNAEGRCQAKGTIEKAGGKIAGNRDLEAEGKDEKFGGKVKEKIGQVEKSAGQVAGFFLKSS